jgi:hypothetical protein
LKNDNPTRKASLQEGTFTLLDDEPAFCLTELAHNRPDFRGFHRYQIIYVPRGEKLSEHWRDLGPAGDFSAGPFRVPGGVIDSTGRIEILHTVAELKEIADQLRIHPARVSEYEPTDLVGAYLDDAEEIKKQVAGASTFGPALIKTRS